MEGFDVGVRYYEKRLGNTKTALERLRETIKDAQMAGAEKIFVAVDTAEDKSGAIGQNWPDYAEVFGVEPWGHFVQPLNAILIKARAELAQGRGILFASTGTSITEAGMKTLLNHMDENTIVVGAALEGHVYEPGIHHNSANGRQVPWNTLALWNPKFLWNTGFLLIGDGPIGEPENAGVEELCTIAVIQVLYPTAKAMLLQVPGQSWDTDLFGTTRHEAKMASKVSRPAAQLAVLGLQGPKVIHI